MSAWNAIPAGQSLGETRADLLAIHFALEIPCSCGCGSPLAEPVELHHGIITKKKFQGVSAKHWDIRDAPCNLFLVNKSCHERIPGAQFFWRLACARYGRQNVESWYRCAQSCFKSRLESYG